MGDEGHVNRLFLKEYQDLLTSDVKEESQEEYGGSRPGTGHQYSEHKDEEVKWRKEQHEEQVEYVVKQRDGAEERESQESVEQATCEKMHVSEEGVCERVVNTLRRKGIWCGGAKHAST